MGAAGGQCCNNLLQRFSASAIMSAMNAIRPVPFPVLLLVLGFVALVSWGRWRVWNRRSTPLKASPMKWGVLVGLFLLITALNAFLNHRLGLPQF
jgi:hypothetical protein